MQIKKNKMGGACGTRGRGELHAGFQWGGTWRKHTTWKI
jgi:hypothetical protein